MFEFVLNALAFLTESGDRKLCHGTGNQPQKVQWPVVGVIDKSVK